MLFNSLEFLIFFPIVTILYFLCPFKYRWLLLLIASYYFYMSWNYLYISLIIISTLIDYCMAIMMERTIEKRERKKYLVLSILSNLSILFLFKYFGFFSRSINDVCNYLGYSHNLPALNLILPIGISFYTFQTMSYTIDVYNRKRKAEKHLGYFALYVSFFPQLVAGPIERSTRLLPQFFEKFNFNYSRVTDGLKLIAWGMFKKVVIADRLAVFVTPVYDKPEMYTGVSFIIATVFFAIQIYCDFSAYSDIAIGSSQILGFRLMDNFNRPYYAKSVSEFWKRWHISLSSWFRDYLYIPLGGKRVTIPRWYMNLLIVFVISGLWHGANWTFIIWGLLNAFYILFSIWTQKIRGKIINIVKIYKIPVISKFISIVITFSLISFSWIFFRSKNVSDAFYIVTHLFSGFNKIPTILTSKALIKKMVFMGQTKYEFGFVIFSICILEAIHFFQRHGSMRHMLSTKPAWIRWFIYYVLVMLIILFKYSSDKSAFIYFQF